jgi:hypothetical protein
MLKRITIIALVQILLVALSCNKIKSISDSSMLKYFPVKIGDSFGYINREGKILINPQFNEATIFREGLALVKSSTDDPKWGFINEEGKYVISPIYNQATVFSDGLAWVVADNESPTAIDKQGNIKFSMVEAKVVNIFSEGLASFAIEDNYEKKWGFVDKTGKIVINPQFEEVGMFSEGQCPFKNGENKWGYIDKKGNITINPQFDEADSYINGNAVVKTGGKSGVINVKGLYTVNPIYKTVLNDRNICLTELDGKWGWCDIEGKTIINNQFKEALLFLENDLAPVKIGNKFGYINKEGKIVVNPQFETALSFNGNLAMVETNNKIGFINNEGKYIINPQFDATSVDVILYLFRNDLSSNMTVKTEYVPEAESTNYRDPEYNQDESESQAPANVYEEAH